MKTMHLLPVPGRPWMVRCKFDYHPRVVDFVKQIPGADWEGKQSFGDKSPYANSKIWLLACEMVPQVVAYAARHGFQVSGQKHATYVADHRVDEADLVCLANAKGPWQPRAVLKAIKDYAHLFNDETGLGKGWEVIQALKLLKARTVLVVCPAQARFVWHNPYHYDATPKGRKGEFDKWWPDHPPATVLEPGKKIPTLADKFESLVVTSYEGLPKLLDALGPAGPNDWRVDAIVADEIHYLQNPKAQRTVAMFELRDRFPDAYRAGMTATAITNHPATVATPLNWLYPGRFVTPFKFARRYSIEGVNSGGFSEFTGLNKEFAEELRERLNAVSSRATKRDPDVAPYLPKFQMMDPIYVNPSKRLDEVVDWTKGKADEGVEHICLLTHLRASAEYLAQELGDSKALNGVTIVTIHGEDSHKERGAKLELARTSPRSIICATLHSVNVAIDMTFNTVVGLAEIYSRPADMIQVLGRFNRLSGDQNCEAFLFASQDMDDGADKLADKLAAIGEVIAHGLSEGELGKSLGSLKGNALTDEEFTKLMESVAEGYNPELATLQVTV